MKDQKGYVDSLVELVAEIESTVPHANNHGYLAVSTSIKKGAVVKKSDKETPIKKNKRWSLEEDHWLLNHKHLNIS